MRKKFIIIIAALIGMSFTLGMLDFLLDSWESRGFISKIIGFLALYYLWYGNTEIQMD